MMRKKFYVFLLLCHRSISRTVQPPEAPKDFLQYAKGSLLEGAHFPLNFLAGFQRNLLEITWYDAIMSCLTKNARGGPKAAPKYALQWPQSTTAMAEINKSRFAITSCNLSSLIQIQIRNQISRYTICTQYFLFDQKID